MCACVCAHACANEKHVHELCLLLRCPGLPCPSVAVWRCVTQVPLPEGACASAVRRASGCSTPGSQGHAPPGRPRQWQAQAGGGAGTGRFAPVGPRRGAGFAVGLPAGGEVSICRLPAWGLSCLLPAPLYLSQVLPNKPPAFLSSRPVCVLDDLADTRSLCPRPPAPPRSEGPRWGLLRQSAGSASPSFKFLLHKAAAASFVAFLSFFGNCVFLHAEVLCHVSLPPVFTFPPRCFHRPRSFPPPLPASVLPWAAGPDLHPSDDCSSHCFSDFELSPPPCFVLCVLRFRISGPGRDSCPPRSVTAFTSVGRIVSQFSCLFFFLCGKGLFVSRGVSSFAF